MSNLPFGRLDVTADLSIDLDGVTGVTGVTAHLTGSGSRLVLTSAQPERLLDAALASALPAGVGQISGPRAVGRVADLLRDAGVQLQVRGPQGTVATIGDDVRSPTGRVLTGSDAVSVGRPGALAALAWRGRRREVLVAVGGTALLTLALRTVLRRREG